MLEKMALYYTQEEIEDRRQKIALAFRSCAADIHAERISSLRASDIESLFWLYDHVFLSQWFRDHFHGRLAFSLSKRMTKSAGITRYPKPVRHLQYDRLQIEIRIGVNFFVYDAEVEGHHSVCGIRTHNRVEALMLVMEHEICHVLELMIYGTTSCRGKRFKALAKSLFGHTESHHRLPTQQQRARDRYTFHLGDTVSFQYKKQHLKGLLINLNKNATVMVPDRNGRYTDQQGHRYMKYYVPPEKLLSVSAMLDGRG